MNQYGASHLPYPKKCSDMCESSVPSNENKFFVNCDTFMVDSRASGLAERRSCHKASSCHRVRTRPRAFSPRWESPPKTQVPKKAANHRLHCLQHTLRSRRV